MIFDKALNLNVYSTQTGHFRRDQMTCSKLNFLFMVPCVVTIQGVTGGTDQTSGECSLGQTIPI